jgi:hypothetical protein
MARFSKRTQENETPDTPEEEEVLLPGEGPAESASDWQGQLNEAFGDTSENDSTENAPVENDDTPQEESEMTETTTAEHATNENGHRVYAGENGETLVTTDAAERLLAEVEGNATPMLEIDSLPKDAKVVKMQLEILKELADEYKALKKQLEKGTSGKDELIAGYIAELDESDDATGKEFRDAFAAAREAREAAVKAERDAEAAFLAHVENELKKSDGGLMSEDEIAAKTAEIKLKYNEYKEQHSAAKTFLDNYRELKNPEVGQIHQYVTHVDRPSGRATTSSGSRNAGPTAGRSVHVSNAFFSTDGGTTWNRSTQEKSVSPTPANPDGKVILSNPQALALDLGKAFSTTVSKDDIVDAWYAASGQTRETASKANMPPEKEFPFTLKNGSGENVTVLVKLAKRL